MKESAIATIAHEADLAARDAVALIADRVSRRGSFLRGLLIYALDCARTGKSANVDGFARTLGLNRATLRSRLSRSRVQMPAIFNRIRLIRAAAVLELPAVTVEIASLILNASSTPAFSRAMTQLTDQRPTVWRETANSRRELAAFEAYLAQQAPTFNALPPLSFFAEPVAQAPRCAGATFAKAAS